MSSAGLSVTKKVYFARGRRGQRDLRVGQRPAPPPPGRFPRVARLMALAIRFDDLIRDGAVTDQADLARIGHVSRARVTQIMNLLHLAPDIQEALLMLPRVVSGPDPITETAMRDVAREVCWQKQRERWRALVGADRCIPVDA